MRGAAANGVSAVSPVPEEHPMTVTILCVIGQTLSASLVAFAFARLSFRSGPAVFVVLSTICFRRSHDDPDLQAVDHPGWIDSLKPLIIPSFFGGGAFYYLPVAPVLPDHPARAGRGGAAGWLLKLGVYWNVILSQQQSRR
jgi:hypothetical protein